MRTITLDFETYYKNINGDTDKYDIKSCDNNYVKYVDDDRFKVHGLAVRDNSGSFFLLPNKIKKYLSTISAVDLILAHNWAFDGIILARKYDFKHSNVIDTKLMANAIFGPKADSGIGADLKSLADKFGLEAKGDLEFSNGVRNLNAVQLKEMTEYATHDVELCYKLYRIMLPYFTRPDVEFRVMQHTLWCYINRPLSYDVDKVNAAILQCKEKRKKAIEKAIPDLIPDESSLSSQQKFVEYLKPLLDKNNIEMPMKNSSPSKVDGSIKKIPALAKNDEGFQKLMKCGIQEIEDLLRARIMKRFNC